MDCFPQRSSVWKGLWLIFMSASMVLWDFTFWLHPSNKLKKLQLKASMNGKIVREFDGRHGDEKVTQGTWQRGQVGQGCQFGYKAFPSVLLTIWRFYSPSFALILYSVLITKSSPFFSFFLEHMLARRCQAEVWHPFGSLPSFLFFQGSICACKNMLPERIHPGN